MTAERESLIEALREKAGDGSTCFIVEVSQDDLRALLSIVDVLCKCPKGPK